jgi:sugar phosphate isomerase/epimerase
MLLTLATEAFINQSIPGPAGTTLPAGREAVLGLPRFAMEQLDLRGLSVSAGMLAGWGLPDLEALRDAADKAACPCLVLVEPEPLAFGHARRPSREKAADRLSRLGTAAHRLGCNSVAIRVAAADDAAIADRAAVGIKEAMASLERLELNLLLSPHEGLTFDPERLTDLIKKVGGFRIGSLPTFEHAHATGDVVGTLRKLAPYAGAVHASVSKPTAKGHKPWDLAECVEAIRSVGFANTLAIDVVGGGDPAVAVERAGGLLRAALEAEE